MLKRFRWAVLLLMATLAMNSCGGFTNPFAVQAPLGPEAFCASSFPSVGYGNFFYCGTSQGNLQIVPFPDGSRGFCQTAQTNNIGLVGYVAYTYNGGIAYVASQSDASAQCSLFGSACPGYIRCTRQ
jgi:hypothetical protein